MSSRQHTHRPRIILDCDPGHDDAIALVVAAHHTDLAGVTTVAGNAPLARTTRNALAVRELLGGTFPIRSGADRPLVAEPRFAGYVHGESGMDGAELPEPSRALDGTDAVEFIIDTCRATEGTWLVPTGPLTNIALALRAAPDLGERIAGISLMGGGTFGNRSALAEFNIWADPEAAAVVFGSGCPLVMAGLDASHRFVATRDRIDRIRELPGRLAATLAGLLDFFSTNYIERHDDMEGAAVHDPLAVLALTHPGLLHRIPRHVAIETRGDHTRGMTVIDRRDVLDRPPPNCEVIEGLDADPLWDIVVAAVAAAAGDVAADA